MKLNKVVLSVKDVDETVKFYTKAFECTVIKEIETGFGKMALLKSGELQMTIMSNPKLPIGIIALGADADEGKLDEEVEKLIKNGASKIIEPSKVGQGSIAKVWDPNKISIHIAEMDLNAKDSGERMTHMANKIK